MGHSRTRRSETCDLRLDGCAFELQYGTRLWFERHKFVRAVLARRCSHDRQRDRALPLRLLAGISDGRGPADAARNRGAWLAAVRREQDVEIARQYRALGDDSRRARPGCAALLLAT